MQAACMVCKIPFKLIHWCGCLPSKETRRVRDSSYLGDLGNEDLNHSVTIERAQIERDVYARWVLPRHATRMQAPASTKWLEVYVLDILLVIYNPLHLLRIP